MTQERWRQVEDLFHRAEELAPSARAAFLLQACEGDPELLREVASLLDLPSGPDHILKHVALDLVGDRDVTQLAAGAELGPYRIESPLGSGGMGIVYRARDTRLSRDVAVKIAARQFSGRFQREARLIASLNHPNICHLYDVGQNYLVMELVEGPTLADRIKAGPLHVDEALMIAAQIADGLAAAHQKGITHRDLKPGNVKVRRDGVVKVLDFGLAKATPPASGDPEVSPTVTIGPTQDGVILGTAAYMAPEQARGEAVDARADIWAYGVLLYELLTGKRLFAGKTTSDTMAAVLKEEPDLSRVPARVRRLLRSCLQKDPKQRLHDIADAMLLLEPEGVAETRTVARSAPLAWTAAAVFALASLILFMLWLGSPRPMPGLVSRWSENYSGDTVGGVALSHDGRRLAYTEGAENLTSLWVRDLDQREPKPIAGPVSPLIGFVRFSPDGQWLAYFERTGELKKIPTTGGTPVALCADSDTGGAGGVSWGDDGTIVFTGKNGGLMRVSSSGGTCEQLTTPDPKTREIHGRPQVLPGSRSVLFTIGTPGAYDNARTAVLDLKTRRYSVAASGGAAARYAPTGHLVYVRGGTLYAVPFDWNRLAVSGAEAAVGADVLYAPANGYADYDFADSGLLVYRPPIPNLKRLEWRDRNGVAEPIPIPARDFSSIRLSPDGRRVAVKIDKGFRNADLWVVDLDRGAMAQLTSGTAVDNEIWMPDGKRVTFSTSEGVYSIPADGSSKPELLFPGAGYSPLSWTPDGKSLLGATQGTLGEPWIWTSPGSGGDGKPRPFFNEPNLRHTIPQVSPDGRSLACDARDAVQPRGVQVYVRPFSGPGGAIPVSLEGGIIPMWSRDGRELFFTALSGDLMAVTIQANPVLRVGKPRRLFLLRTNLCDVAPDGRFLVAKEAATADHLQVVVNWFDELRRKAPPAR